MQGDLGVPGWSLPLGQRLLECSDGGGFGLAAAFDRAGI
jgi:hypothetical protein